MNGAYGNQETKINRQSLTVSEIMSSPVVVAKETTSVKEIAKLMAKHRIDAVVVTNKRNEPVGMVTGAT